VHLGATSCFVTDNTELVQIRSALEIVRGKLHQLMKHLANFANLYKDMPTLGFTHYQPAQLTTVGKRACLWLQDFQFDFEEIDRLIQNLPFRGAKGTTGTQASYLALFDGDHDKVEKLDARVTELMGFSKRLVVTGQTYSRKLDFQVLSALAGVAQSAHKMATDIRLLSNLKEIEEPFESNQIGSSAMAYKRNPMRSERICSLARFAMSLLSNAQNTASVQWFERTLDDSANRRITIPECFMSIDAILQIASNVISGAKVWPLVIRKHVEAELPFMASENILMAAVKQGGDRQELHEVIREFSIASGRRVKEEGTENDFVERIKNDARFSKIDVDGVLKPENYIGRANVQVVQYLSSIQNILDRDYAESAALDEIRV
jgi:adenylosuccinate lyase